MFYNGIIKQPAEKILRLSDSYLEKVKEPMLELNVKMININLSVDHPILQKSRSVYEYSWFVQRVQEYMKNGWTRDEAKVEGIIETYSELGKTKEECLQALIEKFSHFFLKEELEWMIDKHWYKREE